ncbi:unnamed protein product, partial [Arabidopsis halleri]
VVYICTVIYICLYIICTVFVNINFKIYKTKCISNDREKNIDFYVYDQF